MLLPEGRPLEAGLVDPAAAATTRSGLVGLHARENILTERNIEW